MYVGNLPSGVTEKQLREAFSTCGRIEELHVPEKGERGFAFVTFAHLAGAKRALEFRGAVFQGRKVIVMTHSAGKACQGRATVCVCMQLRVAHANSGRPKAPKPDGVSSRSFIHHPRVNVCVCVKCACS